MRLTFYGLTLLLLSACSQAAMADVIIDFEEVGGNVRATYSGTLDLSGLSFSNTSGTEGHNVKDQAVGGKFVNKYAAGSGVRHYSSPFSSAPGVWKTGSSVEADSFGGTHFVVHNLGAAAPLRLLGSDITGGTWTGSGFMQWDSTTLAAMEVDLSIDRIWTINNGSADTITMRAVPEPSAAVSLGLVGAVFSLRRRRRATRRQRP